MGESLLPGPRLLSAGLAPWPPVLVYDCEALCELLGGNVGPASLQSVSLLMLIKPCFWPVAGSSSWLLSPLRFFRYNRCHQSNLSLRWASIICPLCVLVIAVC